MAPTRKDSYSLTVPIDVAGSKEAAAAVKVALVDGSGRVLQSQIVKTGDKQPSATFELEAIPRGARVIVGPENADDDSLTKLQTVTANVSSRLFAESGRATLAAITIAPYYWTWWRYWCRDFTITGTVICPDGKPVPGAQVCAFDVDWFWIWQSKQQIGCAVTDANGFFQISFRWCCGWWPWWWWALRTWEIDFKLADTIYRNLPPELRVKPIPLPDPVPDLRHIEALIPASRMPAKLQPASPVQRRAVAGRSADGALDALKATTSEFFARAEALRPAFAELVPPIAKLPIWPWYPWYPWRDCNPDVIFQVTQPCDGEFKVIVDQDYSQTQWDIPTSYNVTLLANGDACCGEDTPCGDPCLSITEVCDLHRSAVDQTSGSPTAGFAYPGTASTLNKTNADRPFAGSIYVQGLPECMGDDVDWYQVEYSQYNSVSGTWSSYSAVPITSLGAFSRSYFTPNTTPPWSGLSFAPTNVGGITVYPSRKKLEGSLSTPWLCYSNCHILFIWVTSSAAWADGTYRLRLRIYKETTPGTLVEQSLDPCHPDEPNEIVIALDNRPSPDPFHVAANTPGHPCGAGTVHTCTTEPDVDVEAVRLIRADGTVEPIVPCGIYQRQPGDSLEIDYLVEDRSDHLAWYTFDATYGENQLSDLLTSTTRTVITADAAGPTYFDALGQGVSAPQWHGGSITLHIPASQLLLKFPDPCCYQLELRAWKRTIVGCDTRFLHDNLAEYSFFY
jgi:hypothetical protein